MNHCLQFSLERFQPDREWELLDVSVRTEEMNQFSNVYYDFRVRRHNAMEVAVAIAPGIGECQTIYKVQRIVNTLSDLSCSKEISHKILLVHLLHCIDEDTCFWPYLLYIYCRQNSRACFLFWPFSVQMFVAGVNEECSELNIV